MTTTIPNPFSPSIAIIGAGPAGLLLARYLQKHSISCTIYERDSSRFSRAQGGSLDLHRESGQLALTETGLLEKFYQFSRTEGEQMRILDSDGKVWFDSAVDEAPRGPPGEEHVDERPEIDRTDLRNILLDPLEQGTIQWDHHLIAAEPLPSSYRLHFSNRPSITVDILVGADGAWSRIRPLVTPVLPTYSSITFIETVISDVDHRFPHLASLTGDGMTFIASHNRGLIPQRNSNHLIRIYACLRVPETWLDENPIPKKPEDAREWLLSLFSGWDDKVLDLIRNSDDSPVKAHKIYAFPPGHSWTTPLKGITLLGDAAHVMSPFAGEGVNLALLDAYELGKELVNALGKDDWTEGVESGLRTFEKVMLERAAKSAGESQRNLEILFAPSAPEEFVKLVKSYHDGPGAEH